MKDSKLKGIEVAFHFLQRGFIVVTFVLFFLFIGIAMDAYFGTKSLFTIIGSVVAIVGSLLTTFTLVRGIINKLENDDHT